MGFPSWFRVGVHLSAGQARNELEPGGVRVYEQSPYDNSGTTPDSVVDLSHVRVIEARDTHGNQKTYDDPATVAEFISLIRAGKVFPHMPDNTSPTVDLHLGLDRGPPILLQYWPKRNAVDRITVNTRLRELLGVDANFGAAG